MSNLYLKPITLILPYPPSINHYFGQKGHMRFLTQKAKAFRKEVKEEVEYREAANNLSFDLRLTVKLYPPDKRKRDIDNTLKPLLDALEHADVYTNDVHVVELHVTKCPFDGKINSRVEVLIEEV